MRRNEKSGKSFFCQEDPQLSPRAEETAPLCREGVAAETTCFEWTWQLLGRISIVGSLEILEHSQEGCLNNDVERSFEKTRAHHGAVYLARACAAFDLSARRTWPSTCSGRRSMSHRPSASKDG